VTESNAPWFELQGAEMLAKLGSLIDQTFERDSHRFSRYRRALSRYDIRALDSLSPFSFQNAETVKLDKTELRFAFGRMICKTIVAKVAGVQQPKVQYVTSHADWTKRRKARKQDQFTEGLWSTKQEPYCDIWELGAMVCRDAVTCDIGGIKTIADSDAGNILHERVLPEDIGYPHAETRHGSPRTMFHRWDSCRSTLKAMMPEKASVIDGAPAHSTDTTKLIFNQLDVAEDRVLCCETWTLADGPDSPGRHVLFIRGSTESLIDEPWERDSFPITTLVLDRASRGMFGTSVMDETYGIELSLNELLTRMVDTVRRTSLNYVLKPEQTELTSATEDAITIEYQGATPPTLQTPNPLGPGVIQFWELLRDLGFDQSQVNRMSATAVKQPGITANSAILTVADLQSELLSVFYRAYQQMFVELARQDMLAIRYIAKKNPDFSTKWRAHGGEFLRTLSVKDLDLSDQYEIAPQPAPSSKGTAAGRLQAAENLFAAGQLTEDALKSIYQYFDTPGEVERSTRQRDLIDRMMEQWLDASDEQLVSGTNETGGPLVPDPIPWMALEDAIAQVAEGYFGAMMENAPDPIKELFLTWIELADETLVQKNEALARAQAGRARPDVVGAAEAGALGGAPGAPPAPGGPPMPAPPGPGPMMQ